MGKLESVQKLKDSELRALEAEQRKPAFQPLPAAFPKEDTLQTGKAGAVRRDIPKFEYDAKGVKRPSVVSFEFPANHKVMLEHFFETRGLAFSSGVRQLLYEFMDEHEIGDDYLWGAAGRFQSAAEQNRSVTETM